MTLEEKIQKLFGGNEAVKSAYWKLRMDEGMEDAVAVLGVQDEYERYSNRFKKICKTDTKKAGWLVANQVQKYTKMLEKRFSI